MSYVACRVYVVALLLCLLLTGTGCEQDAASPSAPRVSAPEPAVSMSNARLNVHVLGGYSDEVGVYIGHEYFMVQVPVGGYLLRYATTLGTFHLVCDVHENALLFVGLQPDDVVQDAWLFPGTITDIGAETQDHGTVTLYSWPGGPVWWWQVFTFSSS